MLSHDRTHRRGFTIVELLIVIVIIGILATIVIVAYNGITDKAYMAGKEATLSDIDEKFQIYTVVNPAFPSGTSEDILQAADMGQLLQNNVVAADSIYDCFLDDLASNKTKICVVAYPGPSDPSQYDLVYWNNLSKHWIQISKSIDSGGISTTYSWEGDDDNNGNQPSLPG